MKYFELMVYANNAVGANFHYVTEEEKESKIEELEPNNVEEITEEAYNEAKERQHRKFIRLVTGYPKR